jgi:hypothetical protein
LDTAARARGRGALQAARVANLWDVPEFRRYCRPFAPEYAGAQPGLVLRFPSKIVFAQNYFGWPLGPADGAYDPTLFATKIESVGVWFGDYPAASLSRTPHVYLVPVGLDILRAPEGFDFTTREWRVIDQKLPIPFPIGDADLRNPAWIPINDSLGGSFADIRRHSSLRAYPDTAGVVYGEFTSDTRLVGRSVWNTEWLLIIPGGTLLADPDQGLTYFINAVSDIKLSFQTYSYSGN